MQCTERVRRVGATLPKSQMKKLTSWFAAAACLFLSLEGAQAQTLADYDYENLSFRGVGFDFGFIWPSKVEATAAYSLRFDLGYLGPAVRIAPVLSYWKSTFRREELDRLAAQLNRIPGVSVEADDLGTIEWSNLSAGLDAHVVWTTPVRAITYVGGGLGLHVLNGRGPIIRDNLIEDLLDSVSGGVALMAGAEYPVSPQVRFYGEARYTLLSDVHYPGFRFGGAFMLPQPAPAGTSSGR
jgi:hypothetical protein